MDLACLATARTGAGVYIRELLGVWRRGGSPTEIREFIPEEYPVKSGGKWGTIWNHARLWGWIQIQLPFLAWRKGCDVLLSPEYLSPRFCPLPRLVVVYDAAFILRPAEYNRFWLMLFQWIYKPAIRSAGRIVTITETAKRQIAELFKVPADKIAVVPPACNREVYRPALPGQIAPALAGRGLRPKRYFLHVGVMEKRKNLPRLIRAFAEVARAHSGISLVLVGQPGPKQDLDDSETVRAEIEKLGLSERVLLTGHLPLAELPGLYQGATALVFPTLYEGFGIPVLEAFACGTPVACSDLPVLREVAGDGAVYFDPLSESAIAGALNSLLDSDAAAKLTEAGGRQLERFSWEKSARALEALAGELCKRHAEKNH